MAATISSEDLWFFSQMFLNLQQQQKNEQLIAIAGFDGREALLPFICV